MSDNEILELLKKHGVGDDLILANNDLSEFDASSQFVLVEFKFTKQTLNSYLIEMKKLINCFHFAETQGKYFYYIVVNPTNIFIWDVSKMIKFDNIKLECLLLPYQTNSELHGKTTNKISKLITRLSIYKADKTIKRKC